MAVTVVQVQIVDSKQVKLITTKQLQGASYRLKVDNIEDIDGTVIDPLLPAKTFTGAGVAPRVSSAAYYDITHITVVFNEAVLNDAKLILASNYAVTGASTPNVSSVAVISSTTIRLALDADMVSGTYTVTVINVTDIAGNVIDPAFDNASFTQVVKPFRDHATLSTNLVSYYKLDGSAVDSHTNILNGAYFGVPGIAPTQVIGQALSFSGAESIYLPDSPAILDVMTNVSMAAWVWIPSLPATYSTIMGRRGQIYMSIIGAGIYNGYVDCITYTADGSQDHITVAPLSTSVWTHVAVTYDGSYVRLYLNGNLSGAAVSRPGPLLVADATNKWRMGVCRNVMAIDGNESFQSWYTGYFDEIGIWNKTLTSAETTALYNSGAGLTY